jgi:hypothetical protein
MKSLVVNAAGLFHFYPMKRDENKVLLFFPDELDIIQCHRFAASG